MHRVVVVVIRREGTNDVLDGTNRWRRCSPGAPVRVGNEPQTNEYFSPLIGRYLAVSASLLLSSVDGQSRRSNLLRQPRGLRCNGGSQGAALQVLQPMGLHCSEGGRGGCATMVTAGRMRCGCRSHGGCAAGVVCDVVAPMVWQREPLPQPIGLH